MSGKLSCDSHMTMSGKLSCDSHMTSISYHPCYITRFMICCDHCEEWYHGSCVGISVAQGKRMEKESVDYVCPSCKGEVMGLWALLLPGEKQEWVLI